MWDPSETVGLVPAIPSPAYVTASRSVRQLNVLVPDAVHPAVPESSEVLCTVSVAAHAGPADDAIAPAQIRASRVPRPTGRTVLLFQRFSGPGAIRRDRPSVGGPLHSAPTEPAAQSASPGTSPP